MNLIKLKHYCISCGEETDKTEDGHCFDCILYFKDQNWCSGMHINDVIEYNYECKRFKCCRLKEYVGCDDCTWVLI